MVLSHKKKFIFIHNNKAAGTSIEAVLRQKKFKPVHIKFYVTAMMCRDLVGADNWGEYFSFMVVRNPWSKMVSLYEWRKMLPPSHGIPAGMPFSHFIHNIDTLALAKRKPSRHPYATRNQINRAIDEDGNVLLSYIARLENLKKDWRKIKAKLDIKKDLPVLKTTKKKKHWRDYYDGSTKRIVADRFSKDIEFFGYKFEGQLT